MGPAAARRATHHRTRGGRNIRFDISSVEIPRACQKLTEQRGAIDEPARNDMQDAFLALQLPLNLQQPGFDQSAALLASNTLPDDDIHLAAFILERQESHSIGTLRALPHEDNARSPDQPAMCNATEISRGQESIARQPIAQ
jgi:hypothetical protein